MNTLIHILIIYLSFGVVVAGALYTSEYKVPFWNAVGVGLGYGAIVLYAAYKLIRRAIKT